MNWNNKDSIIDRRIGRILFESEIMNNIEYVWIKELLKENKDYSVNKEQFKNLDNKNITFLESSLFDGMCDNALKEWEIDTLKEDEEILECSLCGEKNTKKKFYIKNKLSGKELNVGSTCIKSFGNIKNKNGNTIDQIIREWEKEQKKKVLNDRYNGIIQKIDRGYIMIDKIPTIINAQFEKEYYEISERIQTLYDRFIKNKKEDFELGNEINSLVCKRDDLLDKIHKDIELKKKSGWYITKEIKEWCFKDRERNGIVIGFLKEDGRVRWRSACRIYEINFVNVIIEKFRNIFKNSEIDIVRFNQNNNTIIMRIKDEKPYISKIGLECNYNTFMEEYGDMIFSGEKILEGEREFVISNSKIKDNSSINSSILNIRYLLVKSIIKIYEWDIEFNEVVFILNKNEYYIVRIKEFLNDFIELVFIKELSRIDLIRIEMYILKKGEKVNKEECDNRIKVRKKVDKLMNMDYSKFK
ncbi:MAG: hypothetical protein Q4G05_05335 [Clostridia bacterium]|nr:hypothetical protein [Clostridia bacterium]